MPQYITPFIEELRVLRRIRRALKKQMDVFQFLVDPNDPSHKARCVNLLIGSVREIIKSDHGSTLFGNDDDDDVIFYDIAEEEEDDRSKYISQKMEGYIYPEKMGTEIEWLRKVREAVFHQAMSFRLFDSDDVVLSALILNIHLIVQKIPTALSPRDTPVMFDNFFGMSSFPKFITE